MSSPIVTRACRFEFDPRGFVRATMLPMLEMTLQDAHEAIEATARVNGGNRCPVLVDSRLLKSQSKEARDYLVSEEANRVSSAVALFIGSPVSRMIGNFFMRHHAHRTPVRLFSDEESAVQWLLGFIK